MPRGIVPPLRSDEEAVERWDTHSFAEYGHDIEPADGVRFVGQPRKQVPLRLAPAEVQRPKRIAASKGIGYRTMLRMGITERARQEEAQ